MVSACETMPTAALSRVFSGGSRPFPLKPPFVCSLIIHNLSRARCMRRAYGRLAKHAQAYSGSHVHVLQISLPFEHCVFVECCVIVALVTSYTRNSTETVLLRSRNVSVLKDPCTRSCYCYSHAALTEYAMFNGTEI